MKEFNTIRVLLDALERTLRKRWVGRYLDEVRDHLYEIQTEFIVRSRDQTPDEPGGELDGPPSASNSSLEEYFRGAEDGESVLNRIKLLPGVEILGVMVDGAERYQLFVYQNQYWSVSWFNTSWIVVCRTSSPEWLRERFPAGVTARIFEED